MSKQDDEFLKRLRAIFKVEAEEHLQAISSGLLELEKKPSLEKQAEHIEVIFRHAHSLKGAARAVNLAEIESICQSLESFFAAWKRRDINPVPEHFDTLHLALDLIAGVIPAADGNQAAADKTQFLALTRLLDSPGAGGEEGRVEPVGGAAQSQPVEATRPASQVATAGGVATPAREVLPVASERRAVADTVRMSTAKLDTLLLQAEEMLSVKLTTAQRAADLRNLQAVFERWNKEWVRIQPHVRELRNILERALILSDSGRLTGDDFARILPVGAEVRIAAPTRPAAVVVPYAQAEAEFEKQTLECALQATNGQISEAAKMLRISRATFYKKLAKFGMAPSGSSSV